MRFHFVQSIRSLRTDRPKVAFLIGLLAVVMIPVAGRALLQNTTPRNLPEFLNRQPDVNDQERMRQQQKGDQTIEAVNIERKKKISADSAELFKLAIDLKAELDKTGKDTLSVNAIRKADAIEKLARNLKQEMKLTMGPSL
jgi:hypothetical protein